MTNSKLRYLFKDESCIMITNAPARVAIVLLGLLALVSALPTDVSLIPLAPKGISTSFRYFSLHFFAIGAS
jgi:hypothetical protein